MKKILLIILLVVVCVGIIGGGTVGILRLTDSSKLDQKTISSTKFSVGGLDSNGKYMNTNTSIYTKEAFECQGLEVSLDFDNEIEYQIYFYDQNNEFVHTTGKLSGAFVKESVPFFAKYARIVVTPKEDDVVSKIEVLKYARQLSIKVNREQGFKNYTENLFEVELKDSSLSGTTGEVVSNEGSVVTKYIDVSSYNEAMVVRFKINIPLTSSNYIALYDSSRKFIKVLTMDDSVSFTSSNGYKYFSLSFKNIEDVHYIRCTSGVDLPFNLYCR